MIISKSFCDANCASCCYNDRPVLREHEHKEVKGQRAKKVKLDPRVEMKLKSRKSDLVIEDLAEDLKLLPWQSLQGIKDDRLLIFVLSRVAAKEFSLDEMVFIMNELHILF